MRQEVASRSASELLALHPLKPACTSPWPAEFTPSHTDVSSHAVRPEFYVHFHLSFSRCSILRFNVINLQGEKLSQEDTGFSTLHTTEPKI